MPQKEPPSLLSKFYLGYEMDMTYQEVRKLTRKRMVKDGTGK